MGKKGKDEMKPLRPALRGPGQIVGFGWWAAGAGTAAAAAAAVAPTTPCSVN